MGLGFLDQTPVWASLGVFLAGMFLVWFSGTRVAETIDLISHKQGFDHKLMGMVFLGGATSLPEIVTTTTSVQLGNVPLAMANLLGAVSLQMVVIAVVDFLWVRGAFTWFAPDARLILSFVFLIFMLGLCLGILVLGDVELVWGVGVGSTALFIFYLLALFLIHKGNVDNSWLLAWPNSAQDVKGTEPGRRAVGVLWGIFLFAALGVLLGGLLLAEAADALVEQAGLAQSLAGATFLAMATSLPEFSATVGAVRRGAFTLALSGIVGTNIFVIALIWVVDLVYRDGLALRMAGESGILLCILGILLSCVYLWGLFERRDRTLARMGIDSVVVVILYGLGVLALAWHG